MFPIPYIDFHTHRAIHHDRKDIIEIISMHEVSKNNLDYHTLGYHPWWTHALIQTENIATLESHIKNTSTCLALGECGLDKMKGATSALQEAIFIQQIELANALNVPLIVHCVRQYDQLLKLRKKYSQNQWVVHGFRRNMHLAKSLLDHGILLSVSPFDQMNESYIQMLQYLPLWSFFIETDSDHRWNIIQRYEIMAELKNLDIFVLKEQMYQNCSSLFLWKSHLLTGWKEQNF